MKKVVIWGASPYGRFARLMLDENEYEVIAFFDNGDMAIRRGNIDGIKIDKPEMIRNYEFDFIVIAIAQYSSDIKNQLVSYGVPDNKIVVFMNNGDGLIFHNDTRIAQLKLLMMDIKRKGLEGNIAELGVYKGDFAKYMNAVFPEKKLYLFDTFEGFNDDDEDAKDERTGYNNLFVDTNIDIVLNKMKSRQNIVPRIGWFPDTLAGMPEDEEYCLVSLDTDIYQPMLKGLEYFYPRLQKGGGI